MVAARIKNIQIKKNPIYKYFLWGLFVKIIGAICVCLIYAYYYKEGGDTLMYHRDSSILLNLFLRSPADFFNIWFSPLTKETLSCFTSETGYLEYGCDSKAFMVDRLIVPIKLISFNSYIISSVLMAVLSYTGVWKLYTMFCEFYPMLYKQFAITVLFIPSVFFWGSGLMKDSWTLAATGWYAYSFYKIFIKKDSVLFYAIAILISSAVLISIKPYIFVALLPGSFLWMVWSYLHKIENKFLRIISAPAIFAGGIVAGFFIWSLTSSSLGEYNFIDNMLKLAMEKSEDLKQDYYQGNSFDLGKYSPTFSGMLGIFPEASATGLFRPFIWEAKNIVMLTSGFENLLILLFVLYVFFRRPIDAFICIFSNPVVLFCLIFAVYFAFSVAISTSNFGALVRLRIPEWPFFLSGLIIINNYEKGYSKMNLIKDS